MEVIDLTNDKVSVPNAVIASMKEEMEKRKEEMKKKEEELEEREAEVRKLTNDIHGLCRVYEV